MTYKTLFCQLPKQSKSAKRRLLDHTNHITKHCEEFLILVEKPNSFASDSGKMAQIALMKTSTDFQAHLFKAIQITPNI